jgi:hypothetical protein
MAEEDRDILYAQIINRLGGLDVEQLQELLGSLKPPQELRILPDLVLTKRDIPMSFHYSFDGNKGKYVLENEGPTSNQKVVPVDLNNWLVFDTSTSLLTAYSSGRRGNSAGEVKDFVYMGSGASENQVLIRYNGEETEVLTSGLEALRLRTVPAESRIKSFVGGSRRHLAFREKSYTSTLYVFNRNFRKVVELKDVVASSFLSPGSLGEHLVVMTYESQEHGASIVNMHVYDSEHGWTGASETFIDSEYSVISLGNVPWLEDTCRFIVHDVKNYKLMIYNYSKKHWFRWVSMVSFGVPPLSLGYDMFVTDHGEVYKDLLNGDTNFMKLQEFEGTNSIELRYPNRKKLREVAKKIDIPLSLDVAEIIVSFCVEHIAP